MCESFTIPQSTLRVWNGLSDFSCVGVACCGSCVSGVCVCVMASAGTGGKKKGPGRPPGSRGKKFKQHVPIKVNTQFKTAAFRNMFAKQLAKMCAQKTINSLRGKSTPTTTCPSDVTEKSTTAPAPASDGTGNVTDEELDEETSEEDSTSTSGEDNEIDETIDEFNGVEEINNIQRAPLHKKARTRKRRSHNVKRNQDDVQNNKTAGRKRQEPTLWLSKIFPDTLQTFQQCGVVVKEERLYCCGKFRNFHHGDMCKHLRTISHANYQEQIKEKLSTDNAVKAHKAFQKLFRKSLPEGQVASGGRISNEQLKIRVELTNMMLLCGIPLGKMKQMRPYLRRNKIDVTCDVAELSELVPAIRHAEINQIKKEIKDTMLGTLFSAITDGTTDDGAEICNVVFRWVHNETFQPIQRLVLMSMLGQPMNAEHIVSVRIKYSRHNEYIMYTVQ